MGNSKRAQEELEYYQKLAKAALGTLTTVLAVLFTYVLASPQLNPTIKTSVTGIWLLLLFGIIASGISLLSNKDAIPIAKWGVSAGLSSCLQQLQL